MAVLESGQRFEGLKHRIFLSALCAIFTIRLKSNYQVEEVTQLQYWNLGHQLCLSPLTFLFEQYYAMKVMWRLLDLSKVKLSSGRSDSIAVLKSRPWFGGLKHIDIFV